MSKDSRTVDEDYQEWQVKLIAERLQSIEEGTTSMVSHDDVMAMFEKRFADKQTR